MGLVRMYRKASLSGQGQEAGGSSRKGVVEPERQAEQAPVCVKPPDAPAARPPGKRSRHGGRAPDQRRALSAEGGGNALARLYPAEGE